MKSHPCYDNKTHEDCPNRHLGCKSTCPEWAKWEAQKEILYAKRKKRAEESSAEYEAKRRAVRKSSHRKVR